MAYVIKSYKSNNKRYKRKAEDESEGDTKQKNYLKSNAIYVSSVGIIAPTVELNAIWGRNI